MTVVPLRDAKRAQSRKRGDTIESRIADAGSCPVVPLGHAGGNYWFITAAGEVRSKTAPQLGQRPNQIDLFGGSAVWPLAVFPQTRVVDGVEVEAGYSQNALCDFLMRGCVEAGIFGPHVAIRDVGLWRDAEGAPLVHCGDMVLIEREWVPAGARIGDIVFPIAPRQPKPGSATGDSVTFGRYIHDEIARLWNFREPGSPVVLLGLIATALLGTAAPWRPSGFLSGAPGWGKSVLLDCMRACCPLHHYTNNTSQAGVEGAINNRAMGVFIDEASDRDNAHSTAAILDIVLASGRGDGTKGFRGTADGKTREINVAGNFIYGSVNPPEMKPAHEARITVVNMAAPADGADHSEQMRRLTHYAKSHGPMLWMRMIEGHGRWLMAIQTFREALRRMGCAPREMDQHSAILAGWWTLTRNGVPNAREAANGVAEIRAFVRLAEDVADDSSANRVIAHLMARTVPYDSTTRTAQIGELIEAMLLPDTAEAAFPKHTARPALARHGIRVVRQCEREDRGRPVPRKGETAGIWLYPPLIRQLFHGSAWQDSKWETEMMRLETARKGGAGMKIRFAANVVGAGIWVGSADFNPSEPETFKVMAERLDESIPRLLCLIERADFPIALRPDPPPHPSHAGELMPGFLFDVDRVRRYLARLDQDVGG